MQSNQFVCMKWRYLILSYAIKGQICWQKVAQFHKLLKSWKCGNNSQHFNGHFPSEPGLARLPREFIYRWDALSLTQPTASKHWRINGHKFLQATGCLACHSTNAVNAQYSTDTQLSMKLGKCDKYWQYSKNKQEQAALFTAWNQSWELLYPHTA